jgi:hypothetical protein
MPLSWNEIKSRALAFSKEWENVVSEDAEAKSFWDDFLICLESAAGVAKITGKVIKKIHSNCIKVIQLPYTY